MTVPDRKRIIVWCQHMGDRPHLVLQWHDPATGKRRSKSAGTANPLDAERARADLEYELNNGLHQDTGKMSWEKFRELFEDEYVAPLRKNTRINYGAMLDVLEEVCKPTRIDLVSTRMVSAFAAGLRTLKRGKRDGMKASTVKVRLQFLHTALAWAVEQGFLAEVPKFPNVKVPDEKPKPVPVEAFERLMEAAPDHQMKTYLLTGWLAGLRLSEAYLLEWEESKEAPYVDLANDRIVLPAGFVKGVRDEWVPLDAVLREALEAMPRTGKRVFRFIDGRPNGDGRVIGSCALSRRIVRMAHKAGVRMTMHTLRKGFGCRYAGKVPAQVLQRLMRHQNIATTMNYYANIDDAVREAVLGAGRNSGRNSGRNKPDAAGSKAGKADGARQGEESTSGDASGSE